MVSPRQRGPAFGTRLLLAQGLVLVAGAVTTWVVASAIGPPIFHDHLARAGITATGSETRHTEEAFASALLVAMGVALVAAVSAAFAVAWYFSRRVQHSLGEVARAASQIASGRYAARVSPPGLGAEFDTLADTYNALADRLASTESTRRRMLADLAHEMRTPLATVEAHLEAVEDDVRELDRDTMAVLWGATGQLRRLAEDVAAVSRAEEGLLHLDLHQVDAGHLATSAVAAAAERYAAKGVLLETALGACGPITADEVRLGQVIGNLLENALRHTPRSGTVTLSCRSTDGWIEYTVVDTGEGIAPEHLPHLFDRFYRVDTARDRDHGGSGIGLTIARALVEAHGGGISVTSAGPGRGASFVVRVPG